MLLGPSTKDVRTKNNPKYPNCLVRHKIRKFRSFLHQKLQTSTLKNPLPPCPQNVRNGQTPLPPLNADVLYGQPLTTVFLGFKNYRLRPHGNGFEAVRTFSGQRRSWGSMFCDFVRMCFWTVHFSGS